MDVCCAHRLPGGRRPGRGAHGWIVGRRSSLQRRGLGRPPLAALSALKPAGGIEVVLVNDGSPDGSGEVCRGLVRTARIPITYVEHARNFGEHNAVMTGLRHARGAYVITMDDDLQNPPEEVVRLYRSRPVGGWDVVYTRYAVKKHAVWRNLGSRFANKVADWLLDKPKGLYLSSFRCMSALVVRAVTRYRGPYPYVDGLIMQVTQRIDSIEVRHLPRGEGRSNYNFSAWCASGSTWRRAFRLVRCGWRCSQAPEWRCSAGSVRC